MFVLWVVEPVGRSLTGGRCPHYAGPAPEVLSSVDGTAESPNRLYGTHLILRDSAACRSQKGRSMKGVATLFRPINFRSYLPLRHW